MTKQQQHPWQPSHVVAHWSHLPSFHPLELQVAPILQERADISFSQTPRYNVERSTAGLGIKYHVNGAEFSGHPIAAELARGDKQPRPALQKFEHTVERVYTQDLYTKCQRGADRKERLKNQEVGFFGIGTDWDKVRKIDAEPIESCEELRRMGLLK